MEDDFKKAIQDYNRIAEIYSKFSEEKLMQYQLVKFESYLKGKKILDAGCGSGRDSAYLTEDGYDVTGIDLSEEMIKIAKTKSYAKFKIMDFRNISFKKESFDGVWCMSSMSDIPQNEAKTTLEQFYKVLKKNGILYISTREGSGFKKIKKEKYSVERQYYYYKEEELKNLLLENNFEIILSEVNNSKGVNWVEIFAKKV